MTNSDLSKVVGILARMGSSRPPSNVRPTLDYRYLSTVTQEEHITMPFRVFKADGAGEQDCQLQLDRFRPENVVPKTENQYKEVTTPIKAD